MKSEKFFKNGLLTANRDLLIKSLVNLLIATKLTPRFTDDQLIDLYCTTLELQALDDQVGTQPSFTLYS